MSLLFSSTVSPARQMDCSLTHAESMWVNELEDFDPRIRFAINRDVFPFKVFYKRIPQDR